jgi:chromosome segregation ATPase
MKTVGEIEEQLEQRKTSLADKKASIDQLYSDRAKLIIDNKRGDGEEIAVCDRCIAECKDEIDKMPSVIAELEKQLVAAQQEAAEAQRNKVVTAQKKAGKRVEKLSVELVELLKPAVATNTKLDLAYREYCQLQRVTKENHISQFVCGGSMGSLKYLYELCVKELAGEPVQRQPMTSVPI